MGRVISLLTLAAVLAAVVGCTGNSGPPTPDTSTPPPTGGLQRSGGPVAQPTLPANKP